MKFDYRTRCILILLFLSILICSCAGNTEVQQTAKRVKYYTKDNAPQIDLYRLEAVYQVNKKWIMPKKSKCADSKPTYIVFTILPNGEIKKITYTERSECKELDDSAYSAIVRAVPFKPFPNNLNAEEVNLGLRFSLDGVK